MTGARQELGMEIAQLGPGTYCQSMYEAILRATSLQCYVYCKMAKIFMMFLTQGFALHSRWTEQRFMKPQ